MCIRDRDISEGTYILDTLGNKTSTFEDAYFVNLSEDYDKKAPWLKELTIAPVEFNTDEQAETVEMCIRDRCWSYPPSDVIYPVCYRPLDNPDQRKVFRMAIDFGADIVIGSQAHQPQTYELYGDGIIFYGTGNLFFDQHMWIGTRQGMILSHYMYSGKHIQSKITPIYTDRDCLLYTSRCV